MSEVRWQRSSAGRRFEAPRQSVGILFRRWLFSLLWTGSRKEQVRCVQCETVFQRPTRASRVAWVLLVLLILLVLLELWAELFGPQPPVGQ